MYYSRRKPHRSAYGSIGDLGDLEALSFLHRTNSGRGAKTVLGDSAGNRSRPHTTHTHKKPKPPSLDTPTCTKMTPKHKSNQELFPLPPAPFPFPPCLVGDTFCGLSPHTPISHHHHPINHHPYLSQTTNHTNHKTTGTFTPSQAQDLLLPLLSPTKKQCHPKR